MDLTVVRGLPIFRNSYDVCKPVVVSVVAQRADRTYSDCLKQVAKAALAAGKQCGVLLRRTDDIAPMREMGLTWVAIDSDIGILREKYTRLRASAAGGP